MKNNNKCFQYAVTVALNNEEIRKNPERITKIKPFINKYKWERKNFLLTKDDQKKFKKNNLTIALNVLYAKNMFSFNYSKWRRMALFFSKKNDQHY